MVEGIDFDSNSRFRVLVVIKSTHCCYWCTQGRRRSVSATDTRISSRSLASFTLCGIHGLRRLYAFFARNWLWHRCRCGRYWGLWVEIHTNIVETLYNDSCIIMLCQEIGLRVLPAKLAPLISCTRWSGTTNLSFHLMNTAPRSWPSIVMWGRLASCLICLKAGKRDQWTMSSCWVAPQFWVKNP